MTDIKVIKKFASDVVEFANSVKALAESAKNVEQMRKEASAKATDAQPLNADKLAKAANAVASIYGDRASVSPDTLIKVWSAKHDALVDSLFKVASDRIADKVKEPNMVVVKKASVSATPKASKGTSHRDSFDEIFGISSK